MFTNTMFSIRLLQDFSKLDFRRFLHGGVNLTGFDLVSEDNDEIKKFNKFRENALESEYAGVNEPLTVSKYHFPAQ